MAIKLFGLKTCDTCKAAMKDIAATGKAAEFVDLRTAPDLAARLPRWLAAVGDRLVNRSSTTWRGLSEEEKAKASGATLEGLLMGHPSLIKRPVIEVDGDVLVGWSEATRARIG